MGTSVQYRSYTNGFRGCCMDYVRPSTLSEALVALASRDLEVLAGGTDFYPALRDRPIRSGIIDISRINTLRTIAATPGGWRIGAAATWTDMIRAELPACFDGLKAAGRAVGSPQIQNAGTLAGNLCNASPAADGIPPLLALGAMVELVSRRGTRLLPLADFVVGVRRTARRSDEILTAILIPGLPHAARSAFAKLGARSHLVISIAMVAVTLVPDDTGRIADIRVAVGSCSPVAMRLAALEHDLLGARMDDEHLADRLTPAHVEALSPIDDARGSADYRRHAALELVRRMLRSLQGRVRQSEERAA